MREYRKSIPIVIAICIALMLVQCQSETSQPPLPSPTKAIKGHELYSWQIGDTWNFSLAAGTNRLKTFAEISSAEQQLEGIEALKSALDQLPQGEQLFWSANLVPATALPPAALINEISSYCAQRGLILQLDPAVDMSAAVETPPAEQPVPTLTPTPPMGGWSSYENPVFAVVLQYPPHWQAEAGYSTPQLGDTKYAGDDGFFIVGAMDGPDLDTVTTSTAHHKLQPFGAEPSIEHLTIHGQPSRLISPSDDQPPGMEGYSELIIQYPQPVPITGQPCHFFTLTADRDHILTIAQTLQFTTGTPPASGQVTFPYRYADAGNFVLQAGAVITLTWEEQPLDANRYEFTITPHDQDTPVVLGTDLDASDGVAIEWTVPENLAASLRGVAYFADGQVVPSTWASDIYSGETPPEGICSLSSASIGPLDLFQEPSEGSDRIAYLVPSQYAQVSNKTIDGWFRVSAQITTSPEGGDATTVTGWVPGRAVFELHGSCDDVPLVEP